MWKAKGDVGLAAHVDKAFDNAQHLTKSVIERPNFILAHPDVRSVLTSLFTSGFTITVQISFFRA